MSQNQADKERRARELILAIQALEDEIVRGQSNLQLLEVQSARLAETAMAVRELQKHKPGDEVMVNLGSGVHLQVKLTKTAHVVFSLGAGFAAEKTIEEALASFKRQQQQLEELSRRQQEHLRAIQARIDEMRNQLAQLIQR